MLKTQNIYYNIGNKKILNDISVEFPAGEFHIILGPNGSGKSSFLKIFSGETNDFAGTVFYDERNIRLQKKEQLAKSRAVMSQQPELSFPLMVEEVVMMGRYPHFVFNPNKKDEAVCNEVMDRMNLQLFKDRNYLTLSGGEKQRVQFARVLAQVWEAPGTGSRYLFLDEPIASLDINYQHQFLQMAKSLTKENMVVIAVLHDINLAIQYGDSILFMKEGKLVKKGKPEAIITADLVEHVFNIPVKIIETGISSKPMVVYDQQRTVR